MLCYRYPLASNCQFGVSHAGNDPYGLACLHGQSTGHMRGQVLGGIWTRILTDLIGHYAKIPEEDGLEIARQLHVNWVMLTLGRDTNLGPNDESAHVGTLIEVLEADSDGHGHSPHCDIIRAAFLAHSIDDEEVCP